MFGFYVFNGCGVLNFSFLIGGVVKGMLRNLFIDLNGLEVFGYEVMKFFIFLFFVEIVMEWIKGNNVKSVNFVI